MILWKRISGEVISATDYTVIVSRKPNEILNWYSINDRPHYPTHTIDDSCKLVALDKHPILTR